MEIKFWNTYDTRKTFHQKMIQGKVKPLDCFFKYFLFGNIIK
jgi:hypothetical protein